MLKQIPNALTLLRLMLAPVVAWAVWLTHASTHLAATASLVAAGLFALAALTDLFDGMAARALDAQSKFGRLIDPIADKALVGLPLIVLSVLAARGGWPFWPAIAAASAVIVLRDVSMTLLRLTARDGEGARVSPLAKWKTALELVAVAAPIVAAAAPAIMGGAEMAILAFGAAFMGAWAFLLAIAAALSAYTGFLYLAPRKA